MISSTPLINLFLLLAGLVTLLVGGNFLVRESSRLAKAIGISPAVIGLTIVAFGTSSPEFITCLIASLKGSSDIAVGNIIGSNISNIGLVLGIVAVVSPIVVKSEALKIKLPIMFLFILLFIGLSFNFQLGRIDGLIIFISLILFIVHTYYKRRTLPVKEINDKNNKLKQIFFIIFGIAGLTIGADIFIDKSIYFAKLIGVSELVIGIFVVAVGTSLPELITSVIAALKNEPELLVGNIVGSNIFNIGILGLVSVVKPIEVNQSLFSLEFPLLILFTLLLLPYIKLEKIQRSHGAAALLLYFLFIYLVIY